MAIKDAKIFLTGGAGFIGAKLIERLVEHNRITVYDSLRRDSLKDCAFGSHPNLELIRGDILDRSGLARAMAGAEIVVHLAAIAGVDTVIGNPIQTLNINMIGTSNVLEAALELDNLKRFVNFSTSEVFGQYAMRVKESDSTVIGSVGEARWTYAVSKLAGEHLTHAYYSQHKLPCVTVRPFNVYGPGQVGEGAVHVFITRAINDLDLLIHGDGDQIRSWIFVDDFVDALLECMESPAVTGTALNIGNPRGTITILSLAELVVELAQSRSRIVFEPRRYVDVELRIPNIELARELFGFAPGIDLREGIKRTIAFYREKQRTEKD